MGRTQRVLVDVGRERDAQMEKWGPQHHSPARWLAILAEEFGEAAREANEAEFRHLVELNQALRAELVQTAAVCCAWVEDIDA